MRLHDLSVTAFGPFAGTERVDFDALNDAGLFLLSGATGAGKTSILDAVCFALYGQVPGVRGVKTLKSQHSPDDVCPQVVLDFSVRDRRFVVRRSPEWTRPKRRGHGVATQKARASLLEIRADGEHLLSSRAADVGQMVSELVGMQAAQFQQVAMLPQGEFQRFLLATSQERHDVLQRLFHTDRFSRIEEWVHEQSRRRREAAESGGRATQRLVDGIADRAGVPVPTQLGPDTLAAAATTGEVAPWVRKVLATSAADERAAHAAHQTAQHAATAARAEHESARRAWAAWTRRCAAEAELTVLAADGAAAVADEAALEAHRRATACVPVLAVLDRTRGESDDARVSLDHAEATARAHGLTPIGPGDDRWQAVVDAARARVDRAETLVPLLEAATAARRDAAATRTDLDAVVAAAQQAASEHAALPARLSAARTTLDRANVQSARGEALGLQLESARQRARAAADLPSTERTLLDLQDDVRAARDHAADARERVQDLHQRRLDGIAAELAGRLVDGEACLVCGGTDHPSPAPAAADAVTKAEQEAAADTHDLAQAAHADLVVRAVHAKRQAASLRELAAGRDADGWAADVAELTAARRASTEAAALVGDVEAEIVALERQTAEADRSLRALDLHRAELAEAVRTAEARVSAADAAVDLAWDGDTANTADPAAVLIAAGTALQVAQTVHAAAQTHATRRERVTDLRQQAIAAAADQGFVDFEAVRTAVLRPDVLDRIQQRVAERISATATARAVLADAEVAAVHKPPAAPLPELAAAAEAADDDAQAAARLFHLAEQRHTALRALAGRLTDTLAAWAPVRDGYVLAESMSKLVRGMGSDNQLQMRLSAYVLAARLDQVLDAANERLSHLRDQRYLLQRTDRATRRGSQAGLGLEVVDQWTGDVRDPATLSGGETFVVSLSLALGLADVVTHEAGGIEIETLFVDEGFGTLDADTLDDVMDRLDGLRAGGRSVGVVSHVTELRSRIPTQVHVHKTPSGSSIRTRTLVG